jgi:RNA 2',3'-cyclic 3'-phosphodiesterase
MIVIRAFIGIDFESDLKDNIFQLQEKIKRYAVSGRWKYTDNFHLTLKFLGEISLRNQEQIDEAMKKICIAGKPFSLAVTGLGIFEGRDAVRVLWLGLSGDIPELQSLYKSIDNMLVPIGFPHENRSFSPHITIGQDIVFKCKFDEIKQAIGEVQFSPFSVTGLSLIKSEQIKNKRIYTKIADYYFGNV